jgi:hypothetical protein
MLSTLWFPLFPGSHISASRLLTLTSSVRMPCRNTFRRNITRKRLL